MEGVPLPTGGLTVIDQLPPAAAGLVELGREGGGRERREEIRDKQLMVEMVWGIKKRDE